MQEFKPPGRAGGPLDHAAPVEVQSHGEGQELLLRHVGHGGAQEELQPLDELLGPVRSSERCGLNT